MSHHCISAPKCQHCSSCLPVAACAFERTQPWQGWITTLHSNAVCMDCLPLWHFVSKQSSCCKLIRVVTVGADVCSVSSSTLVAMGSPFCMVLRETFLFHTQGRLLLLATHQQLQEDSEITGSAIRAQFQPISGGEPWGGAQKKRCRSLHGKCERTTAALFQTLELCGFVCLSPIRCRKETLLSDCPSNFL